MFKINSKDSKTTSLILYYLHVIDAILVYLLLTLTASLVFLLLTLN